MFETERNRIEILRDRQPFRVPEGYFEDFTADVMSRLPQKTTSETKVISLYDRIKPWLYIAAIFIGAIVLLQFYNKSTEATEKANKGLYSSVKADSSENEDADFLDYIEELYVDKYAISFIFDDYYIDD